MSVHELPSRITLDLQEAVDLVFDVDDAERVVGRVGDIDLAFRLDGQPRLLSDKLAEKD